MQVNDKMFPSIISLILAHSTLPAASALPRFFLPSTLTFSRRCPLLPFLLEAGQLGSGPPWLGSGVASAGQEGGGKERRGKERETGDERR